MAQQSSLITLEKRNNSLRIKKEGPPLKILLKFELRTPQNLGPFRPPSLIALRVLRMEAEAWKNESPFLSLRDGKELRKSASEFERRRFQLSKKVTPSRRTLLIEEEPLQEVGKKKLIDLYFGI